MCSKLEIEVSLVRNIDVKVVSSCAAGGRTKPGDGPSLCMVEQGNCGKYHILERYLLGRESFIGNNNNCLEDFGKLPKPSYGE